MKTDPCNEVTYVAYEDDPFGKFPKGAAVTERQARDYNMPLEPDGTSLTDRERQSPLQAEPSFQEGYDAGKADRDMEWKQFYDMEASEHQKLATQRREQAMDAHRDGDARLYETRMNLAKTHKSLSDTYHRVARRIENGSASHAS